MSTLDLKLELAYEARNWKFDVQTGSTNTYVCRTYRLIMETTYFLAAVGKAAFATMRPAPNLIRPHLCVCVCVCVYVEPTEFVWNLQISSLPWAMQKNTSFFGKW